MYRVYIMFRSPVCTGCLINTIYIITSDKDYLQLSNNNVFLYNLAFKNISLNKSSTGNAKNDLEIKIIMGDSSDNIPSVFPKCGFKTALKCIQDPSFFQKKMQNNETYFSQYNLNKKITPVKTNLMEC